MSFLAPLYLLLGAAAAVPLLLHLLRRNVATHVDFPAARYLQRAELEHSRSMRLRNLLLMLLRVLLVAALALAAARPFVRGLGVGHGPTAVAVVLDNSLSTNAVEDGQPVLDRLRDATRTLLQSATPADRLWLATSDGRLRGGTRETLLAELARIGPFEGAGDMPSVLRRAAAAVQGSGLPGRAVAVATDGQRSAWRAAAPIGARVALFVPRGDPPANRAVMAVDAEPSRWTPRGALAARIDSRDTVSYRVLLGERTIARGSAGRGEPVLLRAAPPERGWQALRVELEPDDFPADDARWAAVWVGAPPAVRADPSAGPFAATAVSTLVADGRAVAGAAVSVAAADVVGALPALIVPPADPVRLGAANRELARLGIPWRFGALVRAPAIARGARLDGVSVTERYSLVRAGSQASDTASTAGGEPWIVAGPGYVLIASRLEPAATALVVRAPFVPWLADALALRLGPPPGDAGAPVQAAPGAPVRLPAGADALERDGGGRRVVSGERMDAPAERGVWFVQRAGRRIGALVVNAPPEESLLDRYSAEALAPRLGGPRASASGSDDAWVRAAFTAGSRRPAVTPLLLLALLLLAAEAVAARTSRSTAA